MGQIRGLDYIKFYWIVIAAVLSCLFDVQYAFPLHDNITCTTGQWKVLNTINKNYTCRSCHTCPSEHGLSVKCETVVTQEAVLECVRCVSGVNHSSDISLEQCQPCKSTTCLENEFVNGSCSPEEDSTACSGICENGYFMNRDKNGCVSLNTVGAGDNNITLTLTDVPAHTTPSTKTHRLSGLSIALIIVFGCLIICILAGVACCCYRQYHSRNQASENVEMRGTDSSATTSSGNIKQDDQEMVPFITDGNIVQLPSTNFGEASPSLNNNRQETASMDSDSGRIVITTAENEHVAVDNTCDTPCLDVEPDTTARNENPVKNTRETTCLDIETGTTAEDENLPTASPSLSTPNLPHRRIASPTTPNSSVIGDLNENVYAEVCKSLNPDLPGKDWRKMAGEMGFSNNDVRYIAEFRKDNPTDAVLRDWGTKDGNDVHKLITILKDMGRDDVVKILEVALGIPPSSGVEEESY